MKTTAFIPVRLSSSRLPQKHLKLIGNKPLLSWVVKRLKMAKEVEQIVICCADEPGIERLKDLSVKEKVEIFIYKGNIDDVVGRLTEAARKYRPDICILASGDCPLISSETIDKLTRFLKENPKYSIANIKNKKGKSSIHEGILVAKREVWELADKLSNAPYLREHLFPVIEKEPESFSHLKIAQLEDEDIYYEVKHRISVDTPDDLKFMNYLYKELSKRKKDFNLRNVINLLKKNPELIEINKSVKQKGLKDKSYKILIIASAVSNYGYGNLIRAIEIGRKLINAGIGVRFAVFDEKAANICEEMYLHATLVSPKLKEIDLLSRDFHGIIFDINHTIIITKKTVKKLKDNHKLVVFIDNIKGGAKEADLIIIPTAHYVGKKLPNLVCGAEYVVIREEVLNMRDKSDKKGIIAKIDEEYKTQVNSLWKKISFIEGFDKNFAKKLKKSSIAILHLGISCYEAVYLETPVIVIPRSKDENKEIEKFTLFSISDKKKNIGNGAEKIASLIRKMLTGKEGTK